MLEAEYPKSVPEASEPKHFVLAGVARLSEGEFEALDSIITDIKGTLGLVHYLDRSSSITTAINVYFRRLHMCLLK